jgi:hypothetical protein
MDKSKIAIGLPTLFMQRQDVEAGGVMSYGINQTEFRDGDADAGRPRRRRPIAAKQPLEGRTSALSTIVQREEP